MYRLFYLKFYDDVGKFVVRDDYQGLQFGNADFMEKYIQAEKTRFEEMFGMKLKTNPHYKQIPHIPIKRLIEEYCNVMNQPYIDVIGKSRKRELVDVRMFITKTAMKLGYVHGQLRPFFKDGVSYYYDQKMDELIEREDIVLNLWEAYENKVMGNLVSLRHEDGSGKVI